MKLCNLCGKVLLYRQWNNHMIMYHRPKVRMVWFDFSAKMWTVEAVQFRALTFASQTVVVSVAITPTKFKVRRLTASTSSLVPTVGRFHMAWMYVIFKNFIPTQKYDHACKLCPKKFRDRLALRNHQRVHVSPDQLFKCEYCQKRCHTSALLELHHKTRHEKAPGFGQKCQICGKVRPFSSGSSDIRH